MSSPDFNLKTPPPIRVAEDLLMDLEQNNTPFIDDLSQEELKQFSPLINNTKYMYEMAGDPDFENIVIDGMVVYNPKKFPRAAYTRYIVNVWCKAEETYPWKNVTFLVDTGSPDSFVLESTMQALLTPTSQGVIADTFACRVQNPNKMSMKIIPDNSPRINVNLLGVDFFNQFSESLLHRTTVNDDERVKQRLKINLTL